MALGPASVRRVAFGGNCIDVHAVGPASLGVVDLLFAQTVDWTDGATATVAHFALRDLPEGVFQLTCNGDVLHLGSDLGDAALKLQETATAALAGAQTSGLVFHAAAVTRGNGAVVLPGRSGAGKTTLSAHFEHAGGVCLSDETACVCPDRTVEGFRRPFNVKPHGLHLFSRLAGGALDGAPEALGNVSSLAGPAGTLVSFGHPLPRPAPIARPRLCALVFPRYVAGAALQSNRLGAAPAALQLMGHLLNARNLEGHGFESVARLARQVPAYQLEYGEADAAVTWLERLLEQREPDAQQ